MERSRLSIRALVVLASELGAEHLFGVRDPFMMMDHEEIRAAYEVCLEELEQSGAISSSGCRNATRLMRWSV